MLAASLEELQQALSDLWRTLTRDPAKEARKERAWTILAGIFAAIGAMVARKAARKVYGILTGELPPIRQAPGSAPRGGPSSRRAEQELPAAGETEAETQVSGS
jgi:hypothetical protein